MQASSVKKTGNLLRRKRGNVRPRGQQFADRYAAVMIGIDFFEALAGAWERPGELISCQPAVVWIECAHARSQTLLDCRCERVRSCRNRGR